jgi:hypothetical protein
MTCPAETPNAPPIGELLTEQQAAERIGKSPRTLRTWRSDHRGPAYFEIDGRIAYWVRDLYRWLAARTRRVVPPRP